MCTICFKTEEDKINARIEKQLKKDKKLARRDLKVLLLGTGESGKSTFTKQMFIIHRKGFSKAMLDEYRPYVFHNTIVFMQQLLKQMAKYETPLSKPENNANAQLLSAIDINYKNARELFGRNDALSPEIVQAVQQLWADQGVRWVYSKRTEFQLSDSAEYFFTNVYRFGDLKYVPDNTDMLRIRLPTTGIQEHVFEMQGKMMLRIMDVGGQAGERRNWINCFEHVKSIIFLTAMNEYDSFMVEGRQMVRRMSVSLDLFQVILSYPMLSGVSMILFLNKRDLFVEKLKISPLSKTFPEYDGNDNDEEAAAEFIKTLFLDRYVLGDANARFDQNRRNTLVPVSHEPMRSAVMIHMQEEPEEPEETIRTIYSHFTTATDTQNIKFVFAAIKHDIFLINVGEVFEGLRQLN